MNIDPLKLFQGVALSFVFLIAVFVSMEKVFPAKRNQKILRPHWFADLCFFLGQYILWNGLVIWDLELFQFLAERYFTAQFQATCFITGVVSVPSTWTGWLHIVNIR